VLFEPKPLWTVRLFPGSQQKWPMPCAPGPFHRFMQRLILGIVWERIDRA
jgi:hypothetical protein